MLREAIALLRWVIDGKENSHRLHSQRTIPFLDQPSTVWHPMFQVVDVRKKGLLDSRCVSMGGTATMDVDDQNWRGSIP